MPPRRSPFVLVVPVRRYLLRQFGGAVPVSRLFIGDEHVIHYTRLISRAAIRSMGIMKRKKKTERMAKALTARV
jgi:hypothetical protein